MSILNISLYCSYFLYVSLIYCTFNRCCGIVWQYETSFGEMFIKFECVLSKTLMIDAKKEIFASNIVIVNCVVEFAPHIFQCLPNGIISANISSKNTFSYSFMQFPIEYRINKSRVIII